MVEDGFEWVVDALLVDEGGRKRGRQEHEDLGDAVLDVDGRVAAQDEEQKLAESASVSHSYVW